MASAHQNEPPRLLIIAGPNGSGKSSLYADAGLADFGLSVWIINPDLLSARIAEIENRPLGIANVEAVCRIETWLEASINAHQSRKSSADASDIEVVSEIIDRLRH